MGKARDKETYLKSYPKIRKWLNFCIICQDVGYKPELPENIKPGLLAQNIRKYWRELKINDLGICIQCSKHIIDDETFANKK